MVEPTSNNGRSATPTQALASIAGQAVENFRASPALFAIVLLNIAALTAIYFGVRGNALQRHAEFTSMLQHCFKVVPKLD